MVVMIKKIVDTCDTAAQGASVRQELDQLLSSGTPLVVDFTGITNVTSSFTNVAFASLLDVYDFDFIQKTMKITNVNRQIADMIRQRMTAANARTGVAA